MKKFFKNDENGYWLKSLYAIAVIVLGGLLALLLFNLGAVLSFFGNLILSIRALIYGIIMALILYPFANYATIGYKKLLCRKKPHPRLVKVLSLLTVYLGAFLLVGIILLAVLPPMIASGTELAAIITGAAESTGKWMKSIFSNSPILLHLYELVADFLVTYVTTYAGSLLQLVLEKVAGSAVGIIFDLVVGLIISLYLLSGRRLIGGIIGKLTCAVLPERRAHHLSAFVKRLYVNCTEFLAAKIIGALLVGAATYLLFFLIGVPFFPLYALLACFLALFPVLGPIFTVIISSILVLFVSRTYIFAVFPVLLALELLNYLFLTPRILVHRSLRPNWGVSLILLLLGYALLGITGAILAIPVYATIGNTIRTWEVDRLGAKGLPIEPEQYRDFKIEEYDPSVLPKSHDESDGDGLCGEAPSETGLAEDDTDGGTISEVVEDAETAEPFPLPPTVKAEADEDGGSDATGETENGEK